MTRVHNMPIPIHLNSPDRSKNQNSLQFDFTADMLSQMIGSHNSLLTKEAEVADNDADAIFALWENSTILREAVNIEDRLYKVPGEVSSTTIMRLKARGLLYGEKDQIRFTTHAAKIIKMMVLAEGNAFGKRSVKKPYSVILAETKSPKRKSNLALAQKLAEQ